MKKQIVVVAKGLDSLSRVLEKTVKIDMAISNKKDQLPAGVTKIRETPRGWESV